MRKEQLLISSELGSPEVDPQMVSQGPLIQGFLFGMTEVTFPMGQQTTLAMVHIYLIVPDVAQTTSRVDQSWAA